MYWMQPHNLSLIVFPGTPNSPPTPMCSTVQIIGSETNDETNNHQNQTNLIGNSQSFIFKGLLIQSVDNIRRKSFESC